jgi:ABC-type multidrug transport system fused ATPase/permease subunit
MSAFSRIFKYIWPQWPRVVVVVLSAVIVSLLLSLSFMTVIPLLKVMMGEEGLHGWVDRKQCEWRYGLDFYVPETTDFTNNQDAAYQLIVIKVKKSGAADAAGVKPSDRIIGVGKLLTSPAVEKISITRLLEELAATTETGLPVQLKRLNKENILEYITLKLNPPDRNTGFAGLKWGQLERIRWTAKMTIARHAQKLISLLPREQTRENKIKAIILIMIAVGVVTIIRCIAKFYQSYLAEKVVQVGINRLRTDAFAHVMNMPTGFFGNERPSDTVSRLVRDTGQMGAGIKLLLGKALREPLNALVFMAAAVWLNWQLTLVFLLGAPPALALVIILGRKMKRASKKSLAAWSQMLAKLQEVMAGLKIVKVYNQQQYERNSFETINKRLLKQLLKISKVDAATMPVLEVVGMAAGSLALIAGASWVANKQIEGSEFLALLMLFGFSAEAVRKTSDIWNKIQEANAAAERVFAVMDEPLEPEKPDAVELPPLKDKIEFRNIVFTYPGSENPALNGINLAVRAGHNVAIVGPNGSGKTTLANLIPRFYDPDSGHILIDGRDIRDVTLSSLRNQIGMVTQNLVTFNDTIADNIAYGKPGASREEIIAAAKRAFAHEFIELLPAGYDTVIGEQGTGLSGGQLQRIVIARAILKNPPILIFDEATSQVDADSEARIHRAVEEMMLNRTCFIIAHRFSTIITSDLIIVMDQGGIVAQGQHEELMRSCRRYQSLYETQILKTQ